MVRTFCAPGISAVLTLAAAFGFARVPLAAQAMPFHTPSAMPLALSEQAVRGFYQRANLGSLLREGEEVPNPDGLRISVSAVPVVLPVGLTAKTTLFAGVPYIWKTFENGTGERSNSGLGDAFVMVKRELLQRDFVAGNRRLAIFGSLSLPTGETDLEGELLPPALRLGLGTTDVGGFAVYSHVDGRWGVHGRAGYAVALGEDAGFRAGDRWLYDLAFGYRLSPRAYGSMRDVTWSGYLELNGTSAGRARLEDVRLANTGGHTLFLAPGIQVIPAPNWAVEASVQVPLLREPNGTQLAPDWSLAVGGRVLFFLFGP